MTVVEVREALAREEVWLAEAGKVLAALPPDDPRRQKGAEKLRQRQEKHRALKQQLQKIEDDVLEIRYPFAVRWSRQKGVMEIRDCFTGGWLIVEASQVPDHWRWEATAIARRERAARKAA
ncbi:MAG: hypothetical protein GEU71_03570 [Actinobacteria bacterium]|nr:hypothetical protein [Actinomycetota bacterium]